MFHISQVNYSFSLPKNKTDLLYLLLKDKECFSIEKAFKIKFQDQHSAAHSKWAAD